MLGEISSHKFPVAFGNDPFSARESVLKGGMRFVLILAAHVGLIAAGAELASRPEIRQLAGEIYVRLVELPPPPAVKPEVREPKMNPVVRKPEPPPAPAPAPVLTAATEVPAAARFVVTSQPPTPVQVPSPTSAPVPVPVTAARFDADYLHNPKPVYPVLSRRMNEEGTVVLRVRVSAAGGALAVELRKSSGHARLDDAALESVRRWRFVSARQGEETVESWVTLPIAFKLEQ